MNTFQLILKNMRQRALSTCLTTLSVALGVALAIAVLIFNREGAKLFVQSDFGYNVLIGPKGDEMGLVFNSVYGLGTAKGTIGYDVYTDLMVGQQNNVSWAIPFLVGDTWKSKRIMATSNRIVDSPELKTFSQTLLSLDIELRKTLRPQANETADARVARIGNVPAAVKSIQETVGKITDETLAPLDTELVTRFKDLKASLERGAAMTTDTSKPPMVDAGGRIAIDAMDQLRLLAGFAKPFEYRANRNFELAQGRAFASDKFEGIIGAAVAEKLGMKLGDVFQLEHGGKTDDVHDEKWAVVGILKPTNTAMDETLFIPLISSYAVPEHEAGLEAIAKLNDPEAGLRPVVPALPKPATKDDHDEHDDHDDHDHDHHDHEHTYHLHGDRIHLDLTQDKWKVSGIFVGTRGQGAATSQLKFRYMNTPMAMAVPVASTMAEFFRSFLTGPTYVLLALAILVTVVAAVSILVSIYNAVSARRREIAILRALGATRNKVLTLICLEAALVGAMGALLGLVLGHILAAIGSTYLEDMLGHSVAVFVVGKSEWLYLAGVVVIAAIAGLVPALRAYDTSVAENLVAE